MDVLISWSGKQSQVVGGELFAWLKETIPGVAPWISSQSISPGSSWVQVLMGKLETTRFCIICLTPENVRSPWLYYEAGAIAAKLSDTTVTPFLFGLKGEEIASTPFAQLQWTRFEKSDMQKLIATLYAALSLNHDQDLIDGNYSAKFPSLKRK